MKAVRGMWSRGAWVIAAAISMAACGPMTPPQQAAAVAARPAATPPSPTQSGQRVPARNPSVLNELNFGAGGGDIPPLCRGDGDYGPLPESGELIIGVGDWGDDHYYGNGGAISYENVGHTDYTNTDYTGAGWLALPHVCVDDPAYATDVEIVAPSGDVYPPVLPLESFEQPEAILLPPDAFVWGGLWEITLNNLGQFPELGIDSFSVTFDIQPSPSPIQVGVYPDGRLFAVGFDASEQVVALLATPTGEYVDQISLEADETGTIAFDKGGRDVKYVLVGASGSNHVAFGEGVRAPDEAAKESLYQQVWGQ